jgi:MOSC domain-containing protein YiiM
VRATTSTVVSVNVAHARPIGAKSGHTGIDKVPSVGAIEVREPDGEGLSGLAGDTICDTKAHGGRYQAVYAYALEDYQWWGEHYGLSVRPGYFGENLTTEGVNVTNAEIGELWKVGSELELMVTSPRIPCSTFQVWMGRRGWIKTFTREGRPGTYLRVHRGGTVSSEDALTVVRKPGHGVTIGLVFQALTSNPSLLTSLLPALEYLDPEVRKLVLGEGRSAS